MKFVFDDGARVGVIGGGPAGTLFVYFLLTFAERMDMDVTVDIHEPRDFGSAGPDGDLQRRVGGGLPQSLPAHSPIDRLRQPIRQAHLRDRAPDQGPAAAASRHARDGRSRTDAPTGRPASSRWTSERSCAGSTRIRPSPSGSFRRCRSACAVSMTRSCACSGRPADLATLRPQPRRYRMVRQPAPSGAQL